MFREKNSPKVGLGTYTNVLDSSSPYLDFIDNTIKNNHQIDSLLVVYSDLVGPDVLTILSSSCQIDCVEGVNDEELQKELLDRDIDFEKVALLLGDIEYEHIHRAVPLWAELNSLILKAYLLGLDYLFIFSPKSLPEKLLHINNGEIRKELYDFLEKPLKIAEEKEDSFIISSDFSGISYVPPFFNNELLINLLEGIDKKFLISIRDGKISWFKFQSNGYLNGSPLPPEKFFIGNTLINLKKIDRIPPFYSPMVYFGDRELTGGDGAYLWALALSTQGGVIIDHGDHIFFDPYSVYPEPPQHMDDNIIRQFCHYLEEWVVSLPLIDYYKIKTGILGSDIKTLYYNRMTILKRVIEQFSDSMGVDNFYSLLTLYELAYSDLNKSIEKYELIKRIWEETITKLK